MSGYHDDLQSVTKANTFFRQIIYTAPHSQLVAMTLQPQEDIGEETHPVDQFFYIIEGKVQVHIDQETTTLGAGYACLVPAGSIHNVTNIAQSPSRFFTLYAPAHHPEKTVHATKLDALQTE